MGMKSKMGWRKKQGSVFNFRGSLAVYTDQLKIHAIFTVPQKMESEVVGSWAHQYLGFLD